MSARRPQPRPGSELKGAPSWWDRPDCQAMDGDFLLRSLVADQPGVWALVWEPWPGGRRPVYARLSEVNGRVVCNGVWLGLDVHLDDGFDTSGVRLSGGPYLASDGRVELQSDDLRQVSVDRILRAVTLTDPRGGEVSQWVEAARIAISQGTPRPSRKRPGRGGRSLDEHQSFAERASSLAAASPLTWVSDLAVEQGIDTSTVYRRLKACRQRGISVPPRRRRPSQTDSESTR